MGRRMSLPLAITFMLGLMWLLSVAITAQCESQESGLDERRWLATKKEKANKKKTKDKDVLKKETKNKKKKDDEDSSKKDKKKKDDEDASKKDKKKKDDEQASKDKKTQKDTTKQPPLPPKIDTIKKPSPPPNAQPTMKTPPPPNAQPTDTPVPIDTSDQDERDLNLRPERVPQAQFRIRCAYSHSLKDDPIIFPGKPGASHMHDFFGSKLTSAMTTDARKLVGTPSTCFLKADAAAYWFPTLYQRRENKTNGVYLYDALHPKWTLFYYRTAVRNPETIKTIPQGLTMVTGNPKAGLKKESGVNVEWWCGTFGKHFPNFPDEACVGNTGLIAKLNFQSCWNGKDLTSFNGRLHVSYIPLNTTCPPDFPIAIPRISIKVYYPVRQGLKLSWPRGGRAADPPLFLSTFFSGGTGSGMEYHSDFMNGWEPNMLQRLVNECINKNLKCRVINDTFVPPNPFEEGASCGGKACGKA